MNLIGRFSSPMLRFCSALLAPVLGTQTSVHAQNHNPEFEVSNLSFTGSNYIFVGEDDGEVMEPPRTEIILNYRDGGDAPEDGTTTLEWVTDAGADDGSTRVLAYDLENDITGGFTDGDGNSSTTGPWYWTGGDGQESYPGNALYLQGVADSVDSEGNVTNSYSGDTVKLEASHSDSSNVPFDKDFTLLKKPSIVAIEFTSDHNVLRDAEDVETLGFRFPNVEWQPFASTPVNAPMTHTAGSGDDSKIELELTLDLSGLPANTQYTITGDSVEDALDFTKSGTLSGGTDVIIELTATNPIGDEIRKIEASITWNIQLFGSETIDLGNSGQHVIYTTRSTPDISAPYFVPSVPRMDIAVSTYRDALDEAGSAASDARIVWKMVAALANSYNREGGLLNDTQAWSIFTFNNGVDCLSIAKFGRNVCSTIGIPGTFQSINYAAYYNTAAEPARANVAQPNVALNDPAIFPGDLGAPLTANLSSTWSLALADSDCINADDPSAPAGTIGCGPDGFNAFEGAVVYTDTQGDIWYFPAGTTAVFDDADDVLTVFQSLVWIVEEDYDNDPMTPDDYVVKAVEKSYSTAPNVNP